MGPTWAPPGSCQHQMGLMLAPLTLPSGISNNGTDWHIYDLYSMNIIDLSAINVGNELAYHLTDKNIMNISINVLALNLPNLEGKM